MHLPQLHFIVLVRLVVSGMILVAFSEDSQLPDELYYFHLLYNNTICKLYRCTSYVRNFHTLFCSYYLSFPWLAVFFAVGDGLVKAHGMAPAEVSMLLLFHCK